MSVFFFLCVEYLYSHSAHEVNPDRCADDFHDEIYKWKNISFVHRLGELYEQKPAPFITTPGRADHG